MKHLVILLVVLLSLTGCSRKVYIPVENTRTDTLYQYKVKTDSVVFRDSVFLEYKTKGDTVFATKYVTKWRDRFSLRIDTVYKSRTDTITKVQTIEVEKKLTIIDKLQYVGISVCLLCLLAFIFLLFHYRV